MITVIAGNIEKAAAIIWDAREKKYCILISITLFKSEKKYFTKDDIKEIGVLDEETSKSASSTILRAGAGAFVLGPIGLLDGVSGKKKKKIDLKIMFNDDSYVVVRMNGTDFETFKLKMIY